jgi:hypothetical protein
MKLSLLTNGRTSIVEGGSAFLEEVLDILPETALSQFYTAQISILQAGV